MVVVEKLVILHLLFYIRTVGISIADLSPGVRGNMILYEYRGVCTFERSPRVHPRVEFVMDKIMSHSQRKNLSDHIGSSTVQELSPKVKTLSERRRDWFR